MAQGIIDQLDDRQKLDEGVFADLALLRDQGIQQMRLVAVQRVAQGADEQQSGVPGPIAPRRPVPGGRPPTASRI